MKKCFAKWCIHNCVLGLSLFVSTLSADSIVFTGKLVRKYYHDLIPQAVEREIFGWFLELDSFSKICLGEKVAALNEEYRKYCEGFDLTIVQLCLSGMGDRQLCRYFEAKQVVVLGTWPSSPHVFRPIPSYQLHLTQIKQKPGDLVELSGLLHYKVFPGPPNYDSIEDGDYPEGGLILTLDGRSKKTLIAAIQALVVV